MKGTPWSRIKGQNSGNKELWETVGSGKLTGRCSKGDNCSFRHDVNKRAKSTQPNLSERTSTRQSVKNASRTHRQECQWKNVSMALQGFTSKELAPIHSVKNDILQNACSTSRRMDADLVKSAIMRIARLKKGPATRPKRLATKVQ